MVAAVRTFLTFAIIAIVIAAAAGVYLYATTPHETAGVHFPLRSSERAMLASVPASADAFAYIPRAAALHGALDANPVTSGILETWRAERAFPRPWMIGNADVLVWQSGKQTRYLLRLDPIRATVVRMFLMLSGDTGGTVLINAVAEQPIAADELSQLEALAARLPPGDALVVQRRSSRGAYPPMARPAVSMVKVMGDEITIDSRAAGGSGGPDNLVTTFARGAILSTSFRTAPRVIEDLNRVFGAKVSHLFSDGGSIVLYDVDTRKLLPRPIGVLVVPLNSERREALAPLEKLGVRTAERNGELIISFDNSIDRFTADTIDTGNAGAGIWALRMDASRMAPILQQLQESVGLRIASPRLYRGARDLNRWIETLKKAKTVEATDVASGPDEALNVRIRAK